MSNINPAGKENSESAWWSKNPQALFQELNGSENGLSGSEAQIRLTRDGRNVLVEKAKVSAPMLFLTQFKSPIILILLFATAVSGYLGDWQDSIIILAIILGSAILSFVQEYRANDAAEKLRSTVTARSNVLRDGKVILIPTTEVVKGDVVMLSAGSLIPADGMVLEARDFFVNQAVLTGETFPVEKCTDPVPASAGLAERTNVVFMGTNVSSGSSKALIVETGSGTAYGQIAQHLTLRPPETEFERGIRHFGLLLSEVMLILVLTIFAFNVYFQKSPVDSLLFSIALAVGLTPQLLPAIININLSRGSQAMARDGVIVRRLDAIENFGSMDVFCTDKTGTLTLGVVSLDGALGIDGQASEDVFQDAYLNAHYQTGLSNALDEAIQKSKDLDVHLFEKVDEIPYDFVRKRLSVVVQKDGARSIITKGALENILSVCSLVAQGAESKPLEKDQLAEIRKRYFDWSEQGYRVLGLAKKDLDAHDETKIYAPNTESGMTFLGYLLFLDPPKPGVAEIIKDLKSMGVSLKVITGDNHLVAKHLADTIGMDVMGVLTGSELTQMRDEALIHAVEHTNLFTEVDPNQKERIIHALQKRGHVVGYMGDGVNDAPALHTADVGISVESAVDVAKEAADFVLLKQDLAVLHKGIQQGRKTFANTMKYVFMATSANFGNMFSVAGASLFLPFLPMLPKQILLINFLTDFPEMTIASDNVDAQFIQEPHRWDIGFIRSFMFLFGPLSSIYDFLTFGALLLLFHATPELFRTGWFVESIVSATLVVFAVRTRLPFTRSLPSRLMLAVTAAVILVTVAIPYTPLGTIMAFVPLPVPYLVAILVIVGLYFISAELTKRWFYRVKPMK
jgi:P-type Mg2+ transporter